MNFSFGSDPEFMIQHHDQLKSAIDILPDKEDPIIRNGNKFYYDNVLAEIAIKPAYTRQEAISNTEKALKELARLVSPGKFIIRASDNYPSRVINCDEAEIAGCVPEWDIYSFQINEPPESMVIFKEGYYHFKVPFRSAGGHIHIGADAIQKSEMLTNKVVHMMDLFVGLPSVFLDTDETSKARRKAYGQAGSHRTPHHGLEYRVLGNFWFSSPEYVSLMYDLTQFTLNFVESNAHEKFWAIHEEYLDVDASLAYECFGYDLTLLQKSINNCDKTHAEKFMLFIANYLPSVLMDKIDELSGKVLPDPYTAWGL